MNAFKSPRHPLVNAIFSSALLSCCSAMAQPAAPPAAQATPAAANPSAANAVSQVAMQRGALACASRINQVSDFLGYNAQAGVLLMVSPEQVNQRVLPMIMESVTESGPAYVSATFAPNQANGCGATYDAVIYWPLKCEAVAAKQFATLKNIGQLKTDITVLDGGASTKVFLMPAGSGCVSIKKEIVL